MTNLGSDTTPVKGQNFELPAGAQLDEDNGDLVIRDSGGSIVFRRDEANGRWDLEGEDLFNGSQQVYDATNDELTANVNNDSVNTDALSDGVAGDGNTTSLIVGDGGDFVPLFSTQFMGGETVNVSSTSFTQLGTSADLFVPSDYTAFLQNASKKQVSIGYRVESLNNGASQVTVRFRETPASEVTGDSGSNQGSPVDHSIGTDFGHYLEAKVDSGDVDLESMTVILGGEIA